jgi:HEPN superfamily RiboL-PSP-like protein
MNLNEIWAQLEDDLGWRQDEVRLLSNSLSGLTREKDRDRARRAQLVMLYAHVEGYSKIALSTYLKAINDLTLDTQDAAEAIAASALADVFHALTHGDPKGKIFKKPLLQDQGLRTFSRQCEFIGDVKNFLNRPVNVPDEAVDTESNLNSKVLRRNLFRLGFAPDLLTSYDDDLNELVYRRHGIAHGIDIDPVGKDIYDRLKRAAFQLMDELTLLIVQAVEASEFLRKGAPATGP